MEKEDRKDRKEEHWVRKGGEEAKDRRRKIGIHAIESPQSTLGSMGPAFFTIISDTDCLILILLVKKYLSRYKNKPTANYKLSGLKIYSCLCGGGWENSTDMNHSPVIWVFPWHQWAPVQDSVEVCKVPKRQRSQREARRWTIFFFPKDYAPWEGLICTIHFHYQMDRRGDHGQTHFILIVGAFNFIAAFCSPIQL